MNINMMGKLSLIAGKQMLRIKQYSPEILLGAGIAGGIITVGMAIHATLKVDEILEEHEEKQEKIEKARETLPERYSQRDYQQDKVMVYLKTGAQVAKLYAPTIAIGTASVVCILASHRILKTRNVAITAAYGLVQEAFSAYRGRVVKELGPDQDFHFYHGTELVETTESAIGEDGKKTKVRKIVQKLPPGGKPSMYARLFEKEEYDGKGGWTGSTQFSPVHAYNYATLQSKLNWFNDKLNAQGYLFLSTVYEELGFAVTAASQVVGWSKDGDGDGYVSFGNCALDYMAYEDGDPILLDFNVDGNILSYITQQ